MGGILPPNYRYDNKKHISFARLILKAPKEAGFAHPLRKIDFPPSLPFKLNHIVHCFLSFVVKIQYITLKNYTQYVFILGACITYVLKVKK